MVVQFSRLNVARAWLCIIQVPVPAVAVLRQLLQQLVVVVLDAHADGYQPQRIVALPVVRRSAGLQRGP